MWQQDISHGVREPPGHRSALINPASKKEREFRQRYNTEHNCCLSSDIAALMSYSVLWICDFFFFTLIKRCTHLSLEVFPVI
jgi:hypothetical protein